MGFCLNKFEVKVFGLVREYDLLHCNLFFEIENDLGVIRNVLDERKKLFSFKACILVVL